MPRKSDLGKEINENHSILDFFSNSLNENASSSVEKKKENIFEKCLKRQAEKINTIDADDEIESVVPLKVRVVDPENDQSILELNKRVKELETQNQDLLRWKSRVTDLQKENNHLRSSYNQLKYKHVKVLNFCFESQVKIAKGNALLKLPSNDTEKASPNEPSRLDKLVSTTE